MTSKELEKRLIDFAVKIIEIADSLPKSTAAKHLAGQLIRSGTSPALNYGEAQSAESRKDFSHKMKIVLKELRETSVCMQIIYKSKLFESSEKILKAISENDELISIFVKSILTTEKNNKK